MLQVLKYNGKEIARNIEFARTLFRNVIEMKAGTIERCNLSAGKQMEF